MTETRYASFTKRFLAFLIDFFIFVLIHVFSWYLISASNNIGELSRNVMTYAVVVLLPTLITSSIVYTALMTSRFGGSLGKLLTGLKVSDEQGNLLTVKRSIFRHTIGYTFSYTFFGLGYLAIIRDKLKQGWHDKAVGSLVTVKSNTWPIGLLVLIVLLSLNVFLVISAMDRFNKGQLKEQFADLYLAYQLKQEVRESTPSGSLVPEKINLDRESVPAKNPVQKTQSKAPEYTQEDVDAWSEEIDLNEQDIANLQKFKGNSSYDQQKITRAIEILVERKSIASDLYNKMSKNLTLTPSDDAGLARYDSLTTELQQLTKELFGNFQPQ